MTMACRQCLPCNERRSSPASRCFVRPLLKYGSANNRLTVFESLFRFWVLTSQFLGNVQKKRHSLCVTYNAAALPMMLRGVCS